MKRFRIILAAAAALALSACASIPGGKEIAAVATSTVDALTGPDTDYKNYLTSCRAQVKAQADAIEADSKALQAGLTSGDEKTQYGATLIMAFKAGQGGPRIGCSLDRNPRLAELLFKNSDVLGLGRDLFLDYRQGQRFKQQLEVNKELSIRRMEHERDMGRDQNRLITTLTGDELELRESAQDDAYRRQQLEQQAPPPAQ